MQNKILSSWSLPASLIRKCYDPLVPLLKKYINQSIVIGEMPEGVKTAIRQYIFFKKGQADCEDLANYRHVSNLRSETKLIE